MSHSSRVDMIRHRLNCLQPDSLEIHDDSQSHTGHVGAQDGGGHFNIVLVSRQFQDKSAIERHRMIYMALGDAIGSEIHALSISAKTPAEAQSTQVS